MTNHLNFCMMAKTVTWLYADRLKANPESRHKVKGRSSIAFSDVRRIIDEAALDRICPIQERARNNYDNSLAFLSVFGVVATVA